MDTAQLADMLSGLQPDEWMAGAAGVLVAYCGAELCMRPVAVKTASASAAPRWDLFGVFNIAALLAAAAACTSLVRAPPAGSNGWQAMPDFASLDTRTIVAVATLIVCLTYAFAFCGVALVWRAIEDESQNESMRVPKPLPVDAAKRMAAARMERLRAAGMDADVIIVGAGTAGAALATRLGRQGRNVIIIERSNDIPERTVGELLQPGGLAALERMGLSEATDASRIDSIAVEGYVCITPGGGPETDLLLNYPDDSPSNADQFLGFVGGPSAVAAGDKRPSGKVPSKQTSGTGGPPRGRSFWNHLFVHELRRLARAEPLVDFRMGSVRSLLVDGESEDGEHDAGTGSGSCRGVRYVAEDGTRCIARAPLVVVADGMFSIMRRRLDAGHPIPTSSFVGYLLHHAADEPCVPYPNRGHVVMADPNPILLYQITPTLTRILVDIPGVPPAEEGWMRRYMEDRVMHQLPERVRPIFRDALATQEPVTCVNKRLPARPPSVKRALLLGDAWNMRHPLTGGGMTVALRDVETFSNAIDGVDIDEDAALDDALAKFRQVRQGHAVTVNVLANALHRVFTRPDHDDGTRAALREACIEYLKLGGPSSAGPVGLLAALSPKPIVLVSHFFLVALFAIRRALFPCPTPVSIMRSYRLMKIACMIIMPLASAEDVAPLSWAPVRWGLDLIFGWSAMDVDEVTAK
ncbi:hypothetical protein FNF29_03459 [Cafeteria roenbergensis]|uniref:squalene monooxygenase n=1 Tax=Cafeteria roenbergensis TaxID=33653 RepID=A0A5A8CIP2_CAFRO|nr:hypothetical protein FNF29_03459 [Cafeteria roenbergensis]|eukprot:KAA0152935.1 hypothetical protein FNF29_03459 [Cafeteria roenbergensis]